MHLRLQEWCNKAKLSQYWCSKRGCLRGSQNSTHVTSPRPALQLFLLLCSFQYRSVETHVSSKPSVTHTHTHTNPNAQSTVASHRLQLSNGFAEYLHTAGRYANALTYANCKAKCWFETSGRSCQQKSPPRAKVHTEDQVCASYACVVLLFLLTATEKLPFIIDTVVTLAGVQSRRGSDPSVTAPNCDRCATLKQQLESDLEDCPFIMLQRE